jgi:hypothetical protein
MRLRIGWLKKLINKMRILIYFLMIEFISASPVLTPAEIISQREGLNDWRQIAKSASQLPKLEGIEILGKGVRKTSNLSIYSIPETKDVSIALKNALMAIPGHAEFYSNRIRAPFEEFKNPPSDLYTNASGRFLREMMWGGKLLNSFLAPRL